MQTSPCLLNAIDALQKVLGKDASLGMANVFIRIPKRGSIANHELKKQVELTGGGLSRLLAVLAGHHGNGRRTLDTPLITLLDDPVDRRYILISLTPEGQKLHDALNKILKF